MHLKKCKQMLFSTTEAAYKLLVETEVGSDDTINYSY